MWVVGEGDVAGLAGVRMIRRAGTFTAGEEDWAASMLGLLVECCSGDGGGERGQSADSDGTLLE